MNSPTAVALALEIQEWNLLLAGLGELPLKMSRGLYDKIIAQIQMKQEQERRFTDASS